MVVFRDCLYDLSPNDVKKGRKLYKDFCKETDKLVSAWNSFLCAEKKNDAKKCVELLFKHEALQVLATKKRLKWVSFTNSKLRNKKQSIKCFEEWLKNKK